MGELEWEPGSIAVAAAKTSDHLAWSGGTFEVDAKKIRTECPKRRTSFVVSM